MLTSVPQTPITVIQMLTAQTRTEHLHVLANLALLALEHFVMVCKDSFFLVVKILVFRVIFKF